MLSDDNSTLALSIMSDDSIYRLGADGVYKECYSTLAQVVLFNNDGSTLLALYNPDYI